MYNTRPVERSHSAFRTAPEIRTACGGFQPDEIRALGYSVDIRQLGASEEFFQRCLEARAADAKREGRSFRRPAQTDAEIRERAAQISHEIADSEAAIDAALGAPTNNMTIAEIDDKILALECAPEHARRRRLEATKLVIPTSVWEP